MAKSRRHVAMGIQSTLEREVEGAQSSRTPGLRPRCVCIDIETPKNGDARLLKLAAFRPDTDAKVLFEGRLQPQRLKAELDALAQGAAFVLGHNVRRHDIPMLNEILPGLDLTALPIVDTLELSPLAFPQNPYHRLVKDYKLVCEERNHPLLDAEQSLRLFEDEMRAFSELNVSRPDEMAILHFLVVGESDRGLASAFSTLRGAVRPSEAEAAQQLRRALAGKVCSTRLELLVTRDLMNPAMRWPIAYAVSWLSVAGGNSVLPQWVGHTFPETRQLIGELRESPCSQPSCQYCLEHHDPECLLLRYFNLQAFRPLPANAAGTSLQRDIVLAGLRDESHLAILPTGGGKSLCYQLPALEKYWRTGKLTVVVSPLQSLMKDQVDNLVNRGITCAVALNGLLTPLERTRTLEQIRMGDAGIVLVSPEQFRNKAFVDAIRWRDIGAWVFDEAHCLSRWGHDFRTDYLYVSRFIRENFGAERAPVACFTATAKPDVVADLKEHFKLELGVALVTYAGGHQRRNLEYDVVPLQRSEKPARILELVRESLRENTGGAIVFTATRANAETIGAHLRESGWACQHFHAGLEPGTKREVQQDFIDGKLRVIVATNAFGMGVDKPNVRLVIHADIPGSLENYVQEAGRAGRDGDPARCVLLFDPEDVESQFRLSARSRLNQGDFARILRALRKRKARVRDDEVVVTPREILIGTDSQDGIDPEAPDADTKVKTAVAWLERSRFLRREQNRTRVFPASLRVKSLEEAKEKLAQRDLPTEVKDRYLRVLEVVMGADGEEGVSTDELLSQAGIPADECFKTLSNLAAIGLIENDLGIRAVLRKGVVNASDVLLQRHARLEKVLLALMRESAPDAGVGEWQVLTLRPLCTRAAAELDGVVPAEDVVPERAMDVLRAMSRAFDDRLGARHLFTMRKVGAEQLYVKLLKPWSEIEGIAEKRRAVANALLNALLAKIPSGVKSADAAVECKAGELGAVLSGDLTFAAQLADPSAALEQGLLYLHDSDVLVLDKGRTVFRAAMTLKLLSGDDPRRRFTREDFEPLRRHYEERNFQIHVMNEYATLGAKKIADAINLVAAYFSIPRESFVKEHFANRKELLEFATTADSYRKIVDSLNHPVQMRLVQARETGNHLVLAGPGSGKTKVIVHRVAYLLRVLRLPSESIIVLTFNRSAAVEVRRRLYQLVGNDSVGVTILTYHAMALRLTGASLSEIDASGAPPNFEEIFARAISLLEARQDTGHDADELRDRLLRGYRFILVDEYQDIDAQQYQLVSALAGRNRQEGESKLSIMAVGDDDQNIYSFRHTSVEFIKRFADDYKSTPTYLVENYRSTQHIITAANAVIQGTPDRMKVDHPIRINDSRRNDSPGGRWAKLDGLCEGRVHVIRVPRDANVMAQVAGQELKRLLELDPGSDPSSFAFIARTHEALEPLRAWCELHNLPYRTGERGGTGQLSAVKTREGVRVIGLLRGKSKRLVRSGSLARLIDRWSRSEPDNPWMAELRSICEDLAASMGGGWLPAQDAIDWIYESAGTRDQVSPGHVNLLTAHSAKGREFEHVVVLDAGDWTSADADERRLFYVAMTRAKQTLTLFFAATKGNPFVRLLEGSEAVQSVSPELLPDRDERLAHIHRSLTLEDVDIGFAGCYPPDTIPHKVIAKLRHGDSLRIEGRQIKDSSGHPVGKLATNCSLPPGSIARAQVSAVVVRTRSQTAPQFLSRLQSDRWETVLCELVIKPDVSVGMAPRRVSN